MADGTQTEGGLLVGVVATPQRVEAQLVERTGFGRLRTVGRRVVEDVDGPMQFVPLSLERQIVGSDSAPGELRAGAAWVESIANSVAKLTFGMRGGSIRIGVAVSAVLDATGRHVVAARDGARVSDFSSALETAMRGRNIWLASPLARVWGLGEAWARGEVHSALGGLTAAREALVLVWDDDVTWVDVARSQVVRVGLERPGSRLDLGFAHLDAERRERCGSERPLFSGVRGGEACVTELLATAAALLGRAAAQRLLHRPSEETHARRGEPWRAGAPARLVVGGRVGRAFEDAALREALAGPFEDGLAQGLREREDASMLAGLLTRNADSAATDDATIEGLIHVSREQSAPILGAAAGALEIDRPGRRPGLHLAEPTPGSHPGSTLGPSPGPTEDPR